MTKLLNNYGRAAVCALALLVLMVCLVAVGVHAGRGTERARELGPLDPARLGTNINALSSNDGSYLTNINAASLLAGTTISAVDLGSGTNVTETSITYGYARTTGIFTNTSSLMTSVVYYYEGNLTNRVDNP